MSYADGGLVGAGAPRVLCAGIAVRDHVFRLERFPSPGSEMRAREFVAVSGGCAANAAVAVARLNGKAVLASPLGGPAGVDSAGDLILADLAREGIECAPCVRVDGATSPVSAIIVDAAGERLIVNDRDERLSEARVQQSDAYVRECDAVLADNRFASFVLPVCRAARMRRIPTILDGDRPTDASDELLTVCSHVVFAADGLRATAGCEDLGAALQAIARRSGAFLAVTNGAEGVLWLDAGELRHMPAFTVNAIDTLAAGDVFHGAFALALAEGRSEVPALEFATAAAAIKCTRFGGGAGAPRRSEVEAFLASAPSRRSVRDVKRGG